MWAYRLTGTRHLVMTEAPRPDAAELAPREVLLRTMAGGICGSDIPKFEGRPRPADPGSTRFPARVGYPLHEVVGEVIQTRDESLSIGSRVVGWAADSDGCAEYVVTDGRRLATVDTHLHPLSVVFLQPLACVLHALDRVDVRGQRVAVIGLGPIGLLFAHVARARGAASVVGIDPIDRTPLAAAFGLDTVVAAPSSDWAAEIVDSDRPTICIEAVGHQTATLDHALHATQPCGTVLHFGIPDQAVYPVDIERMMRAHLTLMGGVTREHRRALVAAREYAEDFPDLHAHLTTHVFQTGQVQEAFEVAANPRPDRLKVLLDFTR